jgi:hypothetical protein
VRTPSRERERAEGDAANAEEISGDLWIRVGVPGEKQES